ncbi:Fic family protein [Synergistes jonesii]|uniref:Fic family protein n=1 Tax=Synergistes jonesii TaxID=2754 RepID=UPI003CD0CC18
MVFCVEPGSKREIAGHLGYKDLGSVTRYYIKPLLESGRLRMAIPGKPRSRNQRYIKA